nr:ester cyclase [Streptomyces sp. DSM 40976]
MRTHRGGYRGLPYRDLPPTGRSVAYNEIFIFRFAGGRIAEIWGASTSSRSCGSSACLPEPARGRRRLSEPTVGHEAPYCPAPAAPRRPFAGGGDGSAGRPPGLIPFR